MGSETFEDLCNQVYWKLYNKFERKDDPNLRFATNGTAKGELSNELLKRLFRRLLVAEQTALQQFGFTAEDLAERVEERELHDFLAVLIFGSCGIEAARTFTNELVVSDEWPLFGRASGRYIHLLPANREDLLYLFRNTVIVDKFCSVQACFSTVVILKRQEVTVEGLTSQRLPYLEETEVGSGSFGKVYKVKIAKGHFRDEKEGTLNDTPKVLARKDYETTREFDGEKERNILETILTGSSRKCKNILGNLGSIRVGTHSYSLFMPYAICDLSAYMTKYSSTRLSTVHEKAEMILSARGLADGLDYLHNEMKTPKDQQAMVCYHMDLKPSNILVFLETDRNGEKRYVWKLSDFGMARVKIRKTGQTVEREEMDFNSAFLPRSRPEHDRSLSGTRNLRGDGTYLPPESLTATRTMTTASDVWSLGCVLSVVFAYLEDGGEGVESYQQRRLQHAGADGYDRFFLRGGNFKANKDHPEIKKTHTRLIHQAAHRQIEEAHAIEFMLRWLEERVLAIDLRKRAGAKAVKERLFQTYALLKQMPTVEVSSARKMNRHNPFTIFRHFRDHRSAPLSHWQVGSWQLSSVEGLKGCDISPQGTTVAYWSDTKIRLYNELSVPSQTSPNEPPLMKPAAEYELRLNDCIWKSVALTEKYLIASTTGAYFQCYIYDLIFERQYRVTLQLPEISRLAISPDGKMLACVMQSKEEGEDCGFVFIVPIIELIQDAPRQNTPSTQDSSSNETEISLTTRALPNDSTTLKLNWSASDITYISFPTSDEMYLIVQPQITARSRQNEIPIIRLALNSRPRLLQTVIVKSEGVDPGNTVGLFTAFTAFRQQQAICAFIIRGKQLYIQDLADANSPAILSTIKGYRVLKLVMDFNDKKMFALGMPSDTNRIYLLELTIPQSEGEKVTVTELVSLPDLSPDDEITQMLSSDPRRPEEKYFLIAALTTASRRWIYRISLPHPATAS